MWNRYIQLLITQRLSNRDTLFLIIQYLSYANLKNINIYVTMMRCAFLTRCSCMYQAPLCKISALQSYGTECVPSSLIVLQDRSLKFAVIFSMYPTYSFKNSNQIPLIPNLQEVFHCYITFYLRFPKLLLIKYILNQNSCKAWYFYIIFYCFTKQNCNLF